MIYLDSIELLNYALTKLKMGKRDLVPTRDLPEIQQVILIASQKLGNELPVMYRMKLNDIVEAIKTAQMMTQMANLTNVMKDTIIDGVCVLKHEVCVLAWKYYSMNDFEPTPSVIDVMREVVEDHYLCKTT